MIATLIGGTGLTGSCLVRHLLADPAITAVISVSRHSLNISHAKLEEVVVSDLAEIPSTASRIRGHIFFVVSAPRSGRQAARRTSSESITTPFSPSRRSRRHTKHNPFALVSQRWARTRARCSFTIRSRAGLKTT